MFRALFRAIFRGVALIVLVAAGLGIYNLYKGGHLPVIERAVENAALKGAVKAAFAIHRDLSRRDIAVSTNEGEVRLSGAVASDEEKEAASELAASVEGVEEVENLLEVDSGLRTAPEETESLGDKLDDVALLAKVRTALHLDREARKLELDVAVHAGTVVLRGVVPTEAAANRVRARVQSVGGVAAVDDQLVLATTDGSGLE